MFVNLTHHAVTVIAEDGTVLGNIPPSGTVARIAESSDPYGVIGGIPATAVILGEVEGLPDSEPGTTYIVSMPLLMGARATGNGRTDIVYPYGQVRDDAGRIVGCRSLATIA